MKIWKPVEILWLIEEILDAQNFSVFLELVAVVAKDVNKSRQARLAFEVVGQASLNIAGNHHLHGQKGIAFSYSDPGGT